MKEGFYLSLLDAFLLGSAFNRNVFLVSHTKTAGLTKPQGLTDYLQNLLPEGFGLEEEEDGARDPRDDFHLLMCSYHYDAASEQDVNHFIPLRHRTQFDEESDWDVCVSNLKHDIINQKISLQKEMQACVDRHGPEMAADLPEFNDLASRSNFLEAEEKVFCALIDMEYFPQQVPGDGDCLLSSILHLLAVPMSYFYDPKQIRGHNDLRHVSWLILI